MSKKTFPIKCKGNTTLPLDVILEFQGKLKKITPTNLAKLKNNILKNGFIAPLFVWDDKGDYRLLDGHQRLAALISLRQEDYDIPMIPVDIIQAKDEADAKKMLLSITSQYGEFEAAELKEWLDQVDDETKEFLRIVDGEIKLGNEIEHLENEDDVPEVDEEKTIAQPGQIWKLGRHRLMCGDSIKIEDVNKLVGNEKIDLVFTDPPYGMKKEKEGVINDNQNNEDLLQFNKKWIDNAIIKLKENGSFYCWGTDEPLMDIYNEILKPLIKKQKATFRNLITWNKGSGQGQNSEDYRMYPIADEKCIFFMLGVQGFNNNADNYFDGWEPIRNYLLNSRLAMNWDIPTMKKIAGHSDIYRDHWTGKSQFNFPTKEVYTALQVEAKKQRTEKNIKNDAFSKEYDELKKEYDELKKEYDELKKEYDELKKEYYSTRATFNNTHDNMNNVWDFKRTSKEERKTTGGHATPKPIVLCERGILTSTNENESVLDMFGGSGSTLIACEKTKRQCFMIEISPNYCDVIIKRWELFTGNKAELIS